MTLRRSIASTAAVRTGALFFALAAGALGIAFANTESVVAQRFAVALEQAPQESVADAGGHLVSGSEAYWLTAKQRTDATSGASFEPAAWAPLLSGISVGDRITVASGKSERLLEVIAIANVENMSTPRAAASHVAVTCRDLSAPDRAFTTFLVPAGTALGKPKIDRAL